MPADGGQTHLSYFEALTYGLIQGTTEFLPVSSSGHLTLAHLLGLGKLPADLVLPFDVMLHAGTLVAIIIAFRRDIIAATRRKPTFYLALVISITPAGLAGLLATDVVRWVGERYWAVGTCYVYTGLLLAYAQRAEGRIRRRRKLATEPDEQLDTVTLRQAVIVGFLQVFALLPGVSRSGSTVAGGLMGGMGPFLSVSYSFLVGLPLIGAAAGKDAVNGGFARLIDAVGIGPIVVAFCASLVAGLASIAALKLVVAKRGLDWFGAYCHVIAMLCFFLAVFAQ